MDNDIKTITPAATEPQPNQDAGPKWRPLSEEEITLLLQGGNSAADWSKVEVARKGFHPEKIHSCRFLGDVKIGSLEADAIECDGLHLPVGLSHCIIDNCTIGDGCSICNVGYLGGYTIGNGCVLFNIGEMSSQGKVLDFEVAIINESGARSIRPFIGMNTADAYLWAKYRDDSPMCEAFEALSRKRREQDAALTALVEDGVVIKACPLVKDVYFGAHSTVSAALKLRRVAICSSELEPTVLESGIMLEDGIVGYGCRLIDGCTARNFATGTNCTLKSGVRVYDSIIGDNSTIACCEVVSALIFPSHEQHHNNSFLIAACIGGQSNIAAGATIGSNHNSRSGDGELVAGRGFWPGLCVSLKHSSYFASFVLLNKGDYPAELNIRLPFCLVSNNEKEGMLELVPAFWWMHNMYAVARNSWKYAARDRRMVKRQNIEFAVCAPDSMEEVMEARGLIELWTGEALLRSRGDDTHNAAPEVLRTAGADLLHAGQMAMSGLKVYAGADVEKSGRKVRVRKPAESYEAYGSMVEFYAMRQLRDYFTLRGEKASFEELSQLCRGERIRVWANLGGQIVRADDLDELRSDIAAGRIADTDALHARYNELFARYPLDKLRHALQCLTALKGWNPDSVGKDEWLDFIADAERISGLVYSQVVASRIKDFENPFRRAVFRNSAELNAVGGKLEDDSFVKITAEDSDDMMAQIKQWRRLLG